MREIAIYTEPMQVDELAFLVRKEARERKQFYKVTRVLMVLCFVCPYVVAWFRAFSGVEDPFAYGSYFAGVGVLLTLAGLSLYIVYSRSLRRVQRDIRQGQKVIERTHIARKQYMRQNNAYYFYLDSPTRLSIEVQEADFHRLEQGDEVNIEYARWSKVYFGYF